MATDFDRDIQHTLELIQSRYGTATPKLKLSTLLRQNPQLDALDWSLLVLAIEIDLKVNFTEALLDPKPWTVASFAQAVAKLPKSANPLHTLELLSVVADQLVRSDTELSVKPARKKSAQPTPSRKKSPRASKAPKKKPARVKRA